ncbi:MAG: hypothetical protein ACUVTW_06875 [Thermogutta sp.]
MKKVLALALFASFLCVFGIAVRKASGESAVIADETDVDRRFLTALRERFLFQAAEEHCRRQLARNDVSEHRRVLLFVQYLMCLGDHAASAAPPRRDELWELAARTAREFLASESATDDGYWAALQFALLRISQGRLLREELELFGHPEFAVSGPESPPVEAARTPLRDAIRDLRELEQTAAEKLQAIGVRPGIPLPENAWNETDWLGFEKAVQFRLAAAELELALTYPEDGPDRTAALAEAQRRLQVLAELPDDHPAAFDSRLALARACRLLRQWDSARAALAVIERASLTPQAALRLRAESLRLAVDSGDQATLEGILSQGREAGGETSPAYDFALLEAFWTLRSQAEKEGRPTETWNRKILEMLENLRQTGDPYWVRRAELFLAGRGGAASGNDDAMIAVAAENAFRAGRIQEALAGFDRAQAAALRRGAVAEAFRFGLTAAAIASERGDHGEAYRRFAELADRFGDQPQAAQAHLMAIHHLGQLVQTDPNAYLETFASHIRIFLDRQPNHPRGRGLRLRLAQSLELLAKWQEAADEYWKLALSLSDATESQESEDRTPLLSAIEGFGRCTSRYHSSLMAAGKNPAAEVSEAAERLDGWVQQVRQAVTGKAAIRDPAVREAVRLSAQMRLEFHFPAQQTAAMLSQAVEEAEAAQLSRQEYADILFLEAVAHILSGESPTIPWNADHWDEEIVRRVAQRGDSLIQTITDEAAKRKLAELLLSMTESLAVSRRNQKPAEQTAFLESRARWLTIAGRLDAALKAYDQLAEQLPERGDLQEAMVLLLVRKGDPASLESALSRLRTVTQRSPEGSSRWFRAKYLTAWCLAKLHRYRQAAELIAVLQTLHPDLGGDETRELFLQLKRQCESAGQ